jgi:hypothetical protein
MKGFVLGMKVQAARGCPLTVKVVASRVETMQTFLEMMT